MKNVGDHVIKEFPASRLAVIDTCAIGLKKHYVYSFLEVDVTEARKRLRATKKETRVSFTAWLIKCIADLCAKYPEIHAMRYRKLKTVEFHDVDVAIAVEREVQGKKVPLPYVIRKANEKSITEIYADIEEAKATEIRSEGDYVMGGKWKAGVLKAYYAMPGIVRRFLFNSMIKNPFRAKREMGTVVVTAIGMMGSFKGWFVPIGIHPLEIGVGSVVKKPGVAGGKVEVREVLYLTVMADHDAVDGAPAARALSKLTKMMESGYGL